MPLPCNASARCFDALRLLNMTQHTPCHSERSRGISWKRYFSNSPRTGFSCHSEHFIFCHSERSRGISWKRTRRLDYRHCNNYKIPVNRHIRRFLFLNALQKTHKTRKMRTYKKSKKSTFGRGRGSFFSVFAACDL